MSQIIAYILLGAIFIISSVLINTGLIKIKKINFKYVLVRIFLLLAGMAALVMITLPVNKHIVKAASSPVATINLPSDQLIGQTFTAQLIFNNVGNSAGYGPFIDLMLPKSGIDGLNNLPQDGLSITGPATYLGQSVSSSFQVFPQPDSENVIGCNTGQTRVWHPLAVNYSGEPISVCGLPGDELHVFQIPFGSFVSTQPVAVLDLNINISNLADLDQALDLRVRGGFVFGEDALNNFVTDPSTIGSWNSYQVTPTLISLQKTYNGPEAETVSGPNHIKTYTISANIADGQTITDLILTDKLPDNLAYLNLISSSPSGAVIVSQPALGQTTSSPDNQLSLRFPSVTGSTSLSDASFTFEFFAPDLDSRLDEVVNHSTGSPSQSINDALASGIWTPTDPRDGQVVFESDTNVQDYNMTIKSLAIQKSAVNLTNSSQNKPGDVLEYTLNFQVSDYFAFQNLRIIDIFSDGQLFDTAFNPVLSVNELGQNTNISLNTNNFSYQKDLLNDGSTTAEFDLSQALIGAGQDGLLTGGCVTNLVVAQCITNGGPATGTLRFRTVIQDTYTNLYGGGNVKMNDDLDNQVTILGDLLDNQSLIPNGQTVSDSSATEIIITSATFTKSIYALNGDTNLSQLSQISPGDVVTYRIRTTVNLDDFSNMVITDYLPLPVFSVNTFNPLFDSTVNANVPGIASAKYGPDDTFFVKTGIVPSILADTTENTIRFDFGSYSDTSNTSSILDILLSVQVNNRPFADNLLLMNQAELVYGNSPGVTANNAAITPVTLKMPNIGMKKGVVAIDSTSAVFVPSIPSPVTFNSPGSITCSQSNHRFSGTISTANLANNPIDSNLGNVDAGDTITFAVSLENTGGSPNGAFDIQVKDILPANFDLPASGLNLCVTRGDGTPISFNAINPSDTNPLFENGIELEDFSSTQGAVASLGQDNTLGDNIIIITYDLVLNSDTLPNSSYENSAELIFYTGADNGNNNFSTNGIQFDTAEITTRSPQITKSIANTSYTGTTGNNVVVGEKVEYALTINLTEGSTPDLEINDTLDTGLAFVEILDIVSSPDLSTDLPGGFAPLITNPTVNNNGQNLRLNFGRVLNSNTNDSESETITVTYQAVVLNTSANIRGLGLNNSVVLSYNNGTSQTLSSVSSPNIVIQEPALQISKTRSPNTNQDAGDIVTYTLNINHTAPSNAPAQDIALTDVIPSGISYISGTLQHTGGVTPTSLFEASGTISASFDTILTNQSSQLQFQAIVDQSVFPNQLIVNNAGLQWSSLPGDILTPQSSFNSLSTERTGNTLNPGGSANNYSTSGTNNLRINNLNLLKTVQSTSETHTTTVGGIHRVAIGEIVRYRLTTTLPESTVENFRISDNLPVGMQFLDDGTAGVGFSSNGGITSSFGEYASCNQSGSSNLIAPTCIIPSNRITGGPFTSGTDVVFNLGNVVNSDNDGDNEFVVIEFNALVLNIASNQAFNQVTGASTPVTLANNYSGIRQNGASNQTMATSTNLNVVVAEPLVNNLVKTTTLIPQDAQDPTAYRLTFSNTASGVNATTAFEVRVTDVLPSSLTMTGYSVVNSPVLATISDNSNISTNLLDLTFSKLEPGESVTIDINATTNSTGGGQNITNTVNLTYTSLPNSGSLTNPTGSVTPATLTENSERNGSQSPALNDYLSSSSTSFSLSRGAVSKFNTAGTDFRIGEEQEFDILITLPEGENQNVRVRENLPSGLELVSSQILTQTSQSALLIQDFSTSLPSPTQITNTGSIVWNFGNINLPGDNNSSNNSFVVRVRTRVRDVTANQNNALITNSATLISTNADTSTDQDVNGTNNPTIRVVAPILSISKSFLPSAAAPNDNVTIRITVVNNGLAPAYGLNIEDTINNSNLQDLVIQSVADGFSSTLSNNGATSNVVFSNGNILPGQSLIFEIQGRIASNATNAQIINNQVILSGSTSLPDVSIYERIFETQIASANLVVQTPDLRITKTNGQSQVTAGGQTVYNITVVNEGSYRADNVIITETLPSQSVFNPTVSDGAWSTNDGQVFTINIGTLNTGQSRTVQFGVIIGQNFANGQEAFANTASVTDDGTHGNDPTPVNNQATDSDTLIASPDLTVIIGTQQSQIEAGQVAIWDLDYSNIGYQEATGSTLSVQIPPNTSFVEGDSTNGWSCADGAVSPTTCTFALNSILPGQSGQIMIALRVNDSVPAGLNQIEINATIADDGNNGPEMLTNNNFDQSSVQLDAQPEFELEKTNLTNTLTPGLTVTYRLDLRNTGNQGAVNILLTDTLPVEMSFVSASNGGSLNSGIVSWPLFGLPAGQSVELYVTLRVNDSVPAGVVSVTNTAQATDDGSNSPVTIVVQAGDTDNLEAAPDLRIVKTDGGAQVQPGQTHIYTLDVSNIGNQDATGVVITETVPLHTVFDSQASDTGWSCPDQSPSGTVCQFSIGNLLSSQSSQIIFAVTNNPTLPSAVESITNTASVSDDNTNGDDPNLSNNQSSAVTTMFSVPDMVITKTALQNSVEASDIAEFLLTYSNDGNQDATGVVITETVPLHTVFDSQASDTGWSCPDQSPSGTVCQFSIGNLATGQSGQVLFAIKVSDTLPASVETISNIATISDDNTNGDDPNSANNTSQDQITLLSYPDLQISKDNGITSIQNGQIIEYIISAFNDGTQEATGVVITDTLPNGFVITNISDSGVQISANQVQWPAVSLPAKSGMQRSLTMRYEPGSYVPAGIENITNRVTITDDGTNGLDIDLSDNSFEETDLIDADVDLAVSIGSQPAIVEPGDVVDYIVTAQNLGNQIASGTRIYVSLPEGVGFYPAGSDTGWQCANNICMLEIGTLEPGNEPDFMLRVLVEDPSIFSTLFIQSSIEDDLTSGADVDLSNNISQHTDKIIGNPDLSVIKTNNTNVLSPGETTTYQITVTNNGNIITEDVILTDIYPQILEYIDSDNQGSHDLANRTVIWEIDSLLPGQSQVFNVSFELPERIPAGVEDVANNVLVSDNANNGEDQDTGNNAYTDTDFLDADVDLYISQQTEFDLLAPGEIISYDIEFGNLGNQDATAGVIRFTVPANTAFIQQSGWVCQATQNNTECVTQLELIEALSSSQLRLQVRILDAYDIDPENLQLINTLNIEWEGVTEVTMVNNDQTSGLRLLSADLQMEKQVSTDRVQKQTDLTYRLVYRNIGVDVATGVSIIDTLPVGMAFRSAVLENITVTPQINQVSNNQVLTFLVPDIAPGEEKTLFVTVSVSDLAATGELINTAQLQAREFDPEVSNNRSSVPVLVFLRSLVETMISRTGGYGWITLLSLLISFAGLVLIFVKSVRLENK